MEINWVFSSNRAPDTFLSIRANYCLHMVRSATPRRAIHLRHTLCLHAPDSNHSVFCNFVLRCNNIKKSWVLCSSCHLLPGPWRGQSRWFWRTVDWPAGRCEPLNLCAQSSSPPDTSCPSTPGALGSQCSPPIPYPCEDKRPEKRSIRIFLVHKCSFFLRQLGWAPAAAPEPGLEKQK